MVEVDVLTVYMTGIRWKVLLSVSKMVKNLGLDNQIVMVLDMMRLGLQQELVSRQIGVPRTTVSDTFHKMVDALYKSLNFLIRPYSRAHFKKYFWRRLWTVSKSSLTVQKTSCHGNRFILITNKFAKLSKARRYHWSLIIEDHKSLMKVGTPQKNLKLKKFKVKVKINFYVGKSLSPESCL